MQIEIDPKAVRAMIVRIASSPTLRYFIGPCTTTLETLCELGDSCGIPAADTFNSHAKAHADSGQCVPDTLHEIKQLVRLLQQTCKDRASRGLEVRPYAAVFSQQLSDVIGE